MTTCHYLPDSAFEQLVETLQAIMQNARSGAIERWEVRIALAAQGILPETAVSTSAIEDSLIAALRSVSGKTMATGAVRAA